MRQKKNRRRILVLTPRDPYSGVGGDRLRIHRLSRELARYHELTLLTLSKTTNEHTSASPDGVFRNVRRVALPVWKSWLNALAALPTNEPLQVAYYKSAAFQRAFDELVTGHDVVLSHLVRTAPYTEGCSAVRVLEMTDAISMSMERVAQSRPDYFDLRHLLYRIEAHRLAAYERTVSAKFDIVSLTSPVDSKYLFETDAVERFGNALVVPNGADIPESEPSKLSVRNAGEIVFVGNLHSLQNFDAAWFFAHDILPLVRKDTPQAYLRVIGPIGKLARRKLARLEAVRVEGFVPQLDHALSTAQLGVCPVRTGAGIKNKVLDYFAHGLAVVSSKSAIAGINAEDGLHVLLADTPQEWSATIGMLLRDRTQAQRFADAGRKLVTTQYRWEQCTSELIGHIHRRLDTEMPDAEPVHGETLQGEPELGVAAA